MRIDKKQASRISLRINLVKRGDKLWKTRSCVRKSESVNIFTCVWGVEGGEEGNAFIQTF